VLIKSLYVQEPDFRLKAAGKHLDSADSASTHSQWFTCHSTALCISAESDNVARYWTWEAIPIHAEITQVGNADAFDNSQRKWHKGHCLAVV
jgi:hypothetical protein